VLTAKKHKTATDGYTRSRLGSSVISLNILRRESRLPWCTALVYEVRVLMTNHGDGATVIVSVFDRVSLKLRMPAGGQLCLGFDRMAYSRVILSQKANIR
jgi:hypothetical protein